MEHQAIEEAVSKLPLSEIGVIPDDDEIWEETDGNARLKVTRHRLTYSSGGASVEVVALSVSGPQEERRRVIDDFVEVFGASDGSDPGSSDGIETLLWVVDD